MKKYLFLALMMSVASIVQAACGGQYQPQAGNTQTQLYYQGADGYTYSTDGQQSSLYNNGGGASRYGYNDGRRYVEVERYSDNQANVQQGYGYGSHYTDNQAINRNTQYGDRYSDNRGTLFNSDNQVINRNTQYDSRSADMNRGTLYNNPDSRYGDNRGYRYSDNEDNSTMNSVKDQYSTDSDRKISKGLRESLKRNFAGRFEDVSVNVNNGNVTLQGSVASQEDKTAIEQALRNMPGVKNINNQISVSGEAMDQQRTSQY